MSLDFIDEVSRIRGIQRRDLVERAPKSDTMYEAVKKEKIG